MIPGLGPQLGLSTADPWHTLQRRLALHGGRCLIGARGLVEARDPMSRKPIISDTALRYLLPPQLKKMTAAHKQMCTGYIWAHPHAPHFAHSPSLCDCLRFEPSEGW